MNIRRCPLTGRPLPEGYYLHPDVAPRLEGMLAYLPDAFEAATLIERKQATRHKQVGPGGADKARPPLNLSLIEDMDAMRDTLNRWAVDVFAKYAPHARAQAFGDDLPTILAHLLRRKLKETLRWEQAPALYDELAHATRFCGEVIAAAPKARKIISCILCGTPNYLAAVHPYMVCAGCGQTVSTKACATRMAQTVGKMEVTGPGAARLLNQIGIPLKPATIRQWKHRGKIKPITENGEAKYLLIDIINCHESNKHTKPRLG